MYKSRLHAQEISRFIAAISNSHTEESQAKLMKKMTSLTTYEVLDVILPSVLMVVIFVATFVLTVIGIIWKRASWGFDKPNKPVPLVFLELVDLAFPDLEKNKKNGYDVFGSGINVCAFVVLTAIIAPVISSTCFITFWNVYAVEESGGGTCVENFDCFPRMGGEYLQQEPVENCSSLSFMPLDSLNDTNASSLPLDLEITYNCYRLVFRYAEGFGAAGGILAITAFVSKLYFSMLVSIRRSADSRESRFFFHSLVWLMFSAIFIIFLGVNVGIPAIREAVFRTVTDIIQFVMYCTTMVLIIITGVIVAIGIEDP